MRRLLPPIIHPPDKVAALVGGKVAPSDLVALNPVYCRFPVFKLDIDRIKRHAKPLTNLIPVMAVKQSVTLFPDHKRITNAFQEHVVLQLVKFLLPQR